MVRWESVKIDVGYKFGRHECGKHKAKFVNSDKQGVEKLSRNMQKWGCRSHLNVGTVNTAACQSRKKLMRITLLYTNLYTERSEGRGMLCQVSFSLPISGFCNKESSKTKQGSKATLMS